MADISITGTCQECGLPSQNCECDNEFPDDPGLAMCEYCSGTGGEPFDDFCTPCPVCEGEGYKWWL